jgi:hypothetical protein
MDSLGLGFCGLSGTSEEFSRRFSSKDDHWHQSRPGRLSMTEHDDPTHEETDEELELLECCGNCSYSFPAEPGYSEFAICLRDAVFEPYLDRLLENDYSGCVDLIEPRRFPYDQDACADFDPAETIDDPAGLSPELAAALSIVAQLSPDSQPAAKRVSFTDLAGVFVPWSPESINRLIVALNQSTIPENRKDILDKLGWQLSRGDERIFDALVTHLLELPLPPTAAQSTHKCEILEHLSRSEKNLDKLAAALVRDLKQTPSNNQSRTWYTAVFRFFEQHDPALAETYLSQLLNSPDHSYRIKKRIKQILDFDESAFTFWLS